MQDYLPGWELTDRQTVAQMTLQERVDRAIALLREHEPPEGYYLAFSGGKDSCCIKELARMAGVKFEAWYNNTTIDPPELVRYIRKHHADVQWNQPKHGNFFHRLATANKTPPTRWGRWCCEELKEGGGKGRVKVFGVRAAESPGRAHRWREVAHDLAGDRVICPIVCWTTPHVWEFIRAYAVPYCDLYDEGIERLGCVGCPLAGVNGQDKQFARWPRYEELWKRGVIANWERWKDVPNQKGEPRMQAKFATGEDFWRWWRFCDASGRTDVFREDCQSGVLWTNEEE